MTDVQLTDLKGVGPKISEKLNSLDVYSVKELLEYYPRTYADRSIVSNISSIDEGSFYSLQGIIVNISHKRNNFGRIKYISSCILKDQSGQINLVWFNQSYLFNILKENMQFKVYGKVEKEGFFYKMINPEYSIYKNNDFFTIQPVYPKKKGISQYEIRQSIKSALKLVDELIDENLSVDLLSQFKLIHKVEAVKNIHFPKSNELFKRARERLVFEEFFFLQLSLTTLKNRIKSQNNKAVINSFTFERNFISSLPFKLTQSQLNAIEEIKADIQSGYPMNRLIQGDVGSGKTVVALYAVLAAFNAGFQSAFMVPTEILAMQHYETATKLLEKMGVRTALLLGGLKASEKKQTLDKIKKGEVDLIIGTHALIQKDVEFNNLIMCITDEQHRFGVEQRSALTKKGIIPHFIVMSATPIPRTLALILYGDLDVTLIKQLPMHRKPVKTYVVDESFRERILNFILKIANTKQQTYVVCPAINENEELDITGVVETHSLLVKSLPSLKIGLLHGEMKTEDKEEVLNLFSLNKLDVLVSTTVIEVGIDIPNASLIVIEDANRFGLSQLHQLRGRVGRSDKQAYCVLFNQSNSEIAKKRMQVMQESNDGFYISEQDLLLRGPGDFFGTKQHGVPEFKIANLYQDMHILENAQIAVKQELGNIHKYKYLTHYEDYLMKEAGIQYE